MSFPLILKWDLNIFKQMWLEFWVNVPKDSGINHKQNKTKKNGIVSVTEEATENQN